MSRTKKLFTFVESETVSYQWPDSFAADAEVTLHNRIHGEVRHQRIGTFALARGHNVLIACENFYPAEPISYPPDAREDRLSQLAAVSSLLHRLAESGHLHPLNSQLEAAIIAESLYWNPPYEKERAALVQIFDSGETNREFLLSLVPAGGRPEEWDDETVDLIRDQLMELDDEAADGAYPYPYQPKKAMGEPFMVLENSFHQARWG